MNYYNEHDPFAAAWLRELIKANLISPGEVDERSIEDVKPNELVGYRQCHFFAGIGVWSYALRQAGWPDDRPVWTGSCPCQPFSAAGKRCGVTDERHLWPVLYHHISQFRPLVFFGEQVASKDGLSWFDTVSDDLEAAGYTIGSADICAAGFGAPHIRQRLFFVGHTDNKGPQGRQFSGNGSNQRIAGTPSMDGLVANSMSAGRSEGRAGAGNRPTTGSGCPSGLALTDQQQRDGSGNTGKGRWEEPSDSGFWSACDWIPCIDGKARPVEPGTFPLVDGASQRVGRLRGYGNALVAPVAQGFIEAFLEAINDRP